MSSPERGSGSPSLRTTVRVLPALVKARGAGLLVMGAYGHSRIRQLIVGSTTSTLLRRSEVPVLILR